MSFSEYAVRGGAEIARVVPAAPYCLPQDAMNALDTAKLWCGVAAVALGIVALIMIGIGMFFQHNRGDGGQVLKSLGWWIFGTVLVSAAVGLASIFIRVPTDCIPLPG
ncbi:MULTISPECIES: hypothetical protein [Bacteria]|uniref:hypothetical protein n=1 Tax=Bacteria TaxID=2 RepID=UPI003C79A9DE